VARGKRLEGAEFLRVFALVPGSVPAPLTYRQFFALWLNVDSVISAQCFHLSRAIRVGSGAESLPNDWIAAAVTSDAERAQWTQHALKADFFRNRS
jgi:hypothetical protein